MPAEIPFSVNRDDKRSLLVHAAPGKARHGDKPDDVAVVPVERAPANGGRKAPGVERP